MMAAKDVRWINHIKKWNIDMNAILAPLNYV